MPVIRNRRNSRVIDLGDDVASDKANVLGSLPIDLRDQTPFMFSNPARRAAIGSEVFDTQPELHRSWPVVVLPHSPCDPENLVRSATVQAASCSSCRECRSHECYCDCCGCDWIHKVASVWTGLPFTLVMTSPDCNPAFSAGLPVRACTQSRRGAPALSKRLDCSPGSP